MNYFSNKFIDLIEEMKETINTLLVENDIDILKIDNKKFMFNLDGGRYLTGVKESGILVDNSRYEYYFEVLETDKLCELVDYLIQKYN